MFYLLAKLLKKLRGVASKGSVIHKTSKCESGTLLVFASMGKYSFCGYDCSLINVDIGSFCSIANGVSIGGTAHPMHFVSTSPVFLSHKDSVKAKFARHDYLPAIKTIVGDDVWIGERALIKAGVKIGVGAVIGMGAVVTKDVEAYSIVAGNPARHIRYRFDETLREGLLKSEWWKASETDLAKWGPFFYDPQVFLKNRSNS